MGKTITKAAAMEVQECLFAGTASESIVGVAQRTDVPGSVAYGEKNIRSLLRIHRFTVMNWLMTNGVSIPVDLLSDQNHPEVGAMYPDVSI